MINKLLGIAENAAEHGFMVDHMLEIVQRAFGPRAAQAVRELEAPRSTPHTGRRIVTVGTAAVASALAMPARGHTFYGD